MVDAGKVIGQESHVIYAPKYVSTFDFVLRKINGVFGVDHMTRISHIYYRLPITYSLAFWLPERAWLC